MQSIRKILSVHDNTRFFLVFNNNNNFVDVEFVEISSTEYSEMFHDFQDLLYFRVREVEFIGKSTTKSRSKMFQERGIGIRRVIQ